METSRRETHRWKMRIHKKMEEKGEAIERWLSNNGIPLSRKPYIMEWVQLELEEKRDVDPENIFSILPLALQMEMRSCMPLNRLKTVRTPPQLYLTYVWIFSIEILYSFTINIYRDLLFSLL